MKMQLGVLWTSLFVSVVITWKFVQDVSNWFYRVARVLVLMGPVHSCSSFWTTGWFWKCVILEPPSNLIICQMEKRKMVFYRDFNVEFKYLFDYLTEAHHFMIWSNHFYNIFVTHTTNYDVIKRNYLFINCKNHITKNWKQT